MTEAPRTDRLNWRAVRNFGEFFKPHDLRWWLRTACWIVLMTIAVVQLWRVASFDYRSGPLVGDQASHLLQALSIVDSGNLSFDSDDLEAWTQVGWSSSPRGLFFQYNSNGYAFAKPYGYSVFLSPFVWALGPVAGVGAANALLLSILLALVALIVHRKTEWIISLFLAEVLVFGSSAYLFAYVVHPDLFLATASGLIAYALLRLDESGSLTWGLAVGVTIGFAISEKPTLVFAYLLPVLAVLWRSGRRRGALVVGLAVVAAFAVSVLPYTYYSDGSSWNPYSGDRAYSMDGDVPFDSTPDSSSAVRLDSGRYFSISYLTDSVLEDGQEIVESMGYIFVGRYTGMLPFLPMTFVIVALAIGRVKTLDLLGVAFLLGLLGYLAFYAVFFPHNYHGGAQTIGNRYLLQVAPIIAAVIPHSSIGRRELRNGVFLAAAASLLFLGPHHRDPERSFWLLSRTSIAQQLLPFEYDRADPVVFACGTYERSVVIATGSDLCLEVFGVEVERVEVSDP